MEVIVVVVGDGWRLVTIIVCGLMICLLLDIAMRESERASMRHSPVREREREVSLSSIRMSLRENRSLLDSFICGIVQVELS